MEQLDLLWQYQEIELELDKYENDKNNSVVRQKLIKIRNYLVDQQNVLTELERTAEDKKTRFDVLNNEYEQINANLNSEQDKLYSGEIKDVKQLEKFKKSADDARSRIMEKEKELINLMSDIDAINNRLKDISVKASKAKKDYRQLKSQYDEFVDKIKEDMRKLKSEKDNIEGKIEKSLLVKYRNLKLNRNTAIAQIDAEKCGGCNMSLASLVIRNVKEAKKIVECENCGRILYLP